MVHYADGNDRVNEAEGVAGRLQLCKLYTLHVS